MASRRLVILGSPLIRHTPWPRPACSNPAVHANTRSRMVPPSGARIKSTPSTPALEQRRPLAGRLEPVPPACSARRTGGPCSLRTGRP